MFVQLSRSFPSEHRPAVTPEVHISYGQSWRSNYFPNFASFGFNCQPQTLLAPLVSSVGGPTFAPGPLGNGAGINLTGSIVGITGYQGSDVFAQGRCAVLAQQLLRVAGGTKVLTPILEFCAAFPGSTWHTGGGGGLQPGATFTASITNGSMVVTAVVAGDRKLAQNQVVVGSGIPAGTIILDGPNPGTTGTYRVVQGIVVAPGLTFNMANGASFIGGIFPTGDTLNVTTMLSGTIVVGDTITFPPSVPAGTTILAALTGTGGTGTYQVLSGGVQINVSSRTLTTQTTSWTNQGTVISGIENVLPVGMGATVLAELDARGGLNKPGISVDPAMFASLDAEERPVAEAMALQVDGPDPDVAAVARDIITSLALPGSYLDARFRSVGYTQGTSSDATEATKLADLTDMLQLYDAMSLPGTDTQPLNYYLSLPAAVSDTTIFNAGYYGTVDFCRTHAPGQGGTWSGRCFFTSTSHSWLFNGNDNIHTYDYGTARWGEWEGYVRHLVQDLGIAWTPLWRPLTGGAITRAGQVLTVPFARPAGPDFSAGVLSWQNNRDDGVKEWPQKGFHVQRGGVELTVTPTISGMNILLAIVETLSVGDSLEVSYAYRGPGGVNPSTDPGIGGNLVMNGPPSVLFPNGWNGVPKTLDAWAVPFIETVTV